jgi:hypothetical protein
MLEDVARINSITAFIGNWQALHDITGCGIRGKVPSVLGVPAEYWKSLP